MKSGTLPHLHVDLLCVSVCYIAIGVVLLAFPQLSLLNLGYAVGVVFLILGAISIALYFIRKGYLDPDKFGFTAGVTALLLGVFAVLKTNEFAVAFSQVLALFMVFDSILKLQFSMDLLRMKDSKWWILLILSLLMAGLAMAILIYSFPSESVKNYFTYIVLIADGVVNIAATLYLSAKLKKYQEQLAEPKPQA